MIEILEEQMREMGPRFLHVANGTATTSTIEAAGIPGLRSIWADPLYEGPVPGGLGDDELLEVRARHLAGFAGPEERDPLNDLRRWRGAIGRGEPFDELVLWFEHDLFDQLNLVQLLTWISDHLPASTPVSLICIGSFPGHLAFKGLGELAPGELASLFDGRRRVGEAEYRMARAAWQAFRAPNPEALDVLRRGPTPALPYLAAALARFLQEYPWTSDGLSRSERRLLELAAGDGVALSGALPLMHEGESAYYITDLSVAWLAEDLSRTSPPLLTIAAGDDGPLHAGSGRVTLADAGRAVLAGVQDRVAACGIDRWLGGVHLQGRAAGWRWDAARAGIVRRD